MSYNKFPWTNFHGFNLDWVIEKVQECVSAVENFAQEIADIPTIYETKQNITNARKLSPDGNFTGKINGVNSSEYLTKTGDFKGSIHGVDSFELLTEVDSNGDQIVYLTSQFVDGQTGLMVDGGFFGEDEIDMNYDGGVW
jgi:hypothetical protein